MLTYVTLGVQDVTYVRCSQHSFYECGQYILPMLFSSKTQAWKEKISAALLIDYIM